MFLAVRPPRTLPRVLPPSGILSACWSVRVRVQCISTSTETIRLIRDRKPRTATSTFTQPLSSERASVDISCQDWHCCRSRRTPGVSRLAPGGACTDSRLAKVPDAAKGQLLELVWGAGVPPRGQWRPIRDLDRSVSAGGGVAPDSFAWYWSW